MAKPLRRGGRKKNEWTLVSLDELLSYIENSGTRQNAFAKSLGVTNSTFHNWKNGRCAPDEVVQGKIRALIDGKKETTVAKKKAKTAKNKTGGRAPRGAGSTTLAALTGTPKKAAKTTKKKVKQVAKKKATKKKTKKVGRVVAKAANKAADTGLDSWNNLESLGQFVKANPGRSAEAIQSVIDTLTKAQAILG